MVAEGDMRALRTASSGIGVPWGKRMRTRETVVRRLEAIAAISMSAARDRSRDATG